MQVWQHCCHSATVQSSGFLLSHRSPPNPPRFFASADVENMAIDWLTGNMYFVDRAADKIFACDQRGETCVTIVQLDLQNPKGVAVDPLLG